MSSVMPLEWSHEAQRRDRSGTRYVGYPPPPAWNGGVGADDYADVLRTVGARPDEALSVFVQVPFCSVRCLYCTCNVAVGHSGGEVDGYLDALDRELDLVAARLGSGREVLQLHLGGGTPNSLTESQILRLMEMIEARFVVTEGADTAIQCDPRRASAAQFDLLRAFGFRNVRMGVPDVEPAVQKSIGRIQSIELARDVCTMAREAGFETVSLDVTYGLPGQTERSFQATVDKVIGLDPDRVMCFAYGHRPGTRLDQRALNVDAAPTEPQTSALFQRAVDTLTAAGYVWIGLDHFARCDDELARAQGEHRLRRNLMGYHALPPTHVLAFGIGGVGEVDAALVQNELTMKAWQATVDGGELPVFRGHRLSGEDCRRRDAVVHLLCNLELPAELAADGLEEAYARVSRRAEEGLVEVTSDRIIVTPRGRPFLRELCAELDGYGGQEGSAWQS
jgi:oxygen-independent coproporphyrinogen-3 oxidase